MKILIIFGTRPEVIKLVPIIYTLREMFTTRIVSTGQHAELMQNVLDFFRIQPDSDLSCMIDKPDLNRLAMHIEYKIHKAVVNENPDLIIVQGDTLTAYAAAFVGYMLLKPVFHLEAGLRTYDKYSPFPEEMIRALISRIADVHFAPTTRARNNLLAEGIRQDRILVTGNTGVDAVQLAQHLINEKVILDELAHLSIGMELLNHDREFVLITTHRRENIGKPLRNICRAVLHLGMQYKNISFIWPLHMNPQVRKIILQEMRQKSENIILTEALSYQAMIYLMKKARMLLTDSGGIQEEASLFGKPLLILRDTTERPEVIEAGFGVLTGSNKELIIKEFARVYEDKKFCEYMSTKQCPFGDGIASERIAKFLMLDEVKAFVSGYPNSVQKILDVRKYMIHWNG